ncbi:MAG: hypothetical protein QM497_02805 [Sulfurimonas sp.]
MKILLLNDNPVVNKLVTLSAQKTSDELEVVTSIDEISSNTYDLLVVDDNMYNDSLFNDIKEKATFSQSLYICSRDAEQVEEFSSSIKKPFLPTDLVELFSVISHDIDTVDLSTKEEDTPDIAEEELVADEPQETEEELIFDDDELELEDDEELTLDEDELELDEELSLDTEIHESVLDNEEAQKVKDLLDETSEELELDEELELEEEDETVEEELELDEELELEDEDETVEEELEIDEELDIEDDDEAVEEALELDEELELEDDDEAVEEELEIDEELDIEDQIKVAVNELSEDDLNSEVHEETLLDIATNEINSFDTLTSKDLKIAIGEEVEETEEEVAAETKVEDIELTTDEIVEDEEVQTQSDTSNNGVEALKKLLEALTDKDVAASMKGMKISINITLGDN